MTENHSAAIRRRMILRARAGSVHWRVAKGDVHGAHRGGDGVFAERISGGAARPGEVGERTCGKPQKERDATKMLATAVSPEGRLRFAVDTLGAVEYLKGRPEVDAGRIGSIGFCMGGAISGLLATLSMDPRAAVIFYGQSPPPERIPDIQTRVLGIYGSEDPRITGGVPEFAKAMEEVGKSFKHHVYPGAPHAFFNGTRPNYHAEAAQDAWRRVLEFFEENLKGGS